MIPRPERPLASGTGDWKIFSPFFHKLRAILVAPFALCGVFCIRLLRPWVVVRISEMVTRRIGPLAGNTELYLCERDAGMHQGRFYDLFWRRRPVSNRQLERMWKRATGIRVVNCAYWVDKYNRLIPGGGAHILKIHSSPERDNYNLLYRSKPHLSFTPQEEEQGQAFLRSAGVNNGAPFVCFMARDSAYLRHNFRRLNWDYQDYRDTTIENCLPAGRELVRRGYYAFRMGAVVNGPLRDPPERVIDYASRYRCDFLDIYLSAKCAFYICPPVGIGSVAMIFRRPVIWTNLVSLEYIVSWNPYDLCIPKKLRWARKERLLTFKEIFELGVAQFWHKDQYQKLGIELVENTPEEITAVALEMDARLKGNWHSAEEDEELQRKFWSLFKPGKMHGRLLARIGAEFLRQNKGLLD